MQVVKIHTGFGKTTMDDFGNELVRFTYDDGEASYVALKAFPDVDTLIEDVVGESASPMMKFLIAMGKNTQNGETRNGATVTEWTEIYSQTTH